MKAGVEDTMALTSTPAPVASVDLPVGDPHRYKTGDEIGRGGLGRVLRAQDTRLDRTVAIKEAVSRDGPIAARFAREALITARLQHPSIVPIYDAGRWPDGQAFYAMKLVSGRPLGDLVEEAGALDKRLALLPHLIAVADAIAYAHSRHIIHRDLKPDNVLVGEFGETVVIDWGIAKDLSNENEDDALLASPYKLAAQGMTVAGAVIGTPAYMAPEQAAGARVDERTDVYAIGGMLYHALTGLAPVRGESAYEVLDKVRAGHRPTLDPGETGVPTDLATIVHKATAKEPADRYPTAKELAADLKRFQAGQLVSSRRYSSWALTLRWIRRNRLPLAIAAAAALILAIVGAVAVRRVVRERNAANAANAAATAKANELILVHARSMLDRDPTASLAWLKTYSPEATDWPEAQRIADDALSRGVALHTLHHDHVAGVTFSPGGHELITAGRGGLHVWNTVSGKLVRTVDVGDATSLSAADDGTVVVTAGPLLQRVQPDGARSQLFDKLGEYAVVLLSHDGHRAVSVELFGAIRTHDMAGVTTSIPSMGSVAPEWQALSSDGAHFATANEDGNVVVYALDGGAPRTLAAHPGGATCVAFSLDGQWLASAGHDGGVRIWDLEHLDAAPIALNEHVEPVRGLLFLPGGALVSQDARTVRRWDVAARTSRVVHIAPSNISILIASGDRIAIGHTDGDIWLWNSQTGEQESLLGQSSRINSLAFSPVGDFLASAADNGSVRVWSVPPAARRVLATPAQLFTQAIISPDQKLVATADSDSTITVWSTAGGDARRLNGHTEVLQSLAFDEAGAHLLSSSYDGTVRTWDVVSGESHVLPLEGPPSASGFLPDGNVVVAGDEIATFSLDGVKQSGVRPDESILALAVSKDGLVALSGRNGTLYAWKPGETLRKIGHAERPIYELRFVDGGQRLIAGGTDDVTEWDVQNGAPRPLLQVSTRGFSVSSDETLVAIFGTDAVIRVVARSGGDVRELIGHGGLSMIAFAPGNDLLATGGDDGTVRVWSLDRGSDTIVHRHDGAVRTVVWGRDGRTLVSSSVDGTVWMGELGELSFLATDEGTLRDEIAARTTATIE